MSLALKLARATMMGAAGFDFDKISVIFGRVHPPLFAFRAPNTSKNTIVRRRMPGDDAIRGRALAFSVP